MVEAKRGPGRGRAWEPRVMPAGCRSLGCRIRRASSSAGQPRARLLSRTAASGAPAPAWGLAAGVTSRTRRVPGGRAVCTASRRLPWGVSMVAPWWPGADVTRPSRRSAGPWPPGATEAPEGVLGAAGAGWAASWARSAALLPGDAVWAPGALLGAAVGAATEISLTRTSPPAGGTAPGPGWVPPVAPGVRACAAAGSRIARIRRPLATSSSVRAAGAAPVGPACGRPCGLSWAPVWPPCCRGASWPASTFRITTWSSLPAMRTWSVTWLPWASWALVCSGSTPESVLTRTWPLASVPITVPRTMLPVASAAVAGGGWVMVAWTPLVALGAVLVVKRGGGKKTSLIRPRPGWAAGWRSAVGPGSRRRPRRRSWDGGSGAAPGSGSRP